MSNYYSRPVINFNRSKESTKTQFHVFCGDDEDYGYPYSHRYNEPDSDRGASDEGWDDGKEIS